MPETYVGTELREEQFKVTIPKNVPALTLEAFSKEAPGAARAFAAAQRAVGPQAGATIKYGEHQLLLSITRQVAGVTIDGASYSSGADLAELFEGIQSRLDGSFREEPADEDPEEEGEPVAPVASNDNDAAAFDVGSTAALEPAAAAPPAPPVS